MKIKQKPKKNIRLCDIRPLEKGYISYKDVRPIMGHGAYNFAINLCAIVYTEKSKKNCVGVCGIGHQKLDFEIDLSNFITGYPILYFSLPKGKNYDWHLFSTTFERSVYDVLVKRVIENFVDNWLVSTDLEKLHVEINSFLNELYQDADISYILQDRASTIASILRLEDLDQELMNEFCGYTHKEKKALLELYHFKLNFIHYYLLQDSRWKLLDKDTYLSIRDYWVDRENYEMLIEPSKHFKL